MVMGPRSVEEWRSKAADSATVPAPHRFSSPEKAKIISSWFALLPGPVWSGVLAPKLSLTGWGIPPPKLSLHRVGTASYA